MGAKVARLLPWLVVGALAWALWHDLHPRIVLPVHLPAVGPDCRDVKALSVEELRHCARWLSQEDPQGARLRPLP